MGRSIAKFDGRYLLWSSVTDSPVTYLMTRAELAQYLLHTEGYDGIVDLAERLTRVDKFGTSDRIGTTVEDLLAHNHAGPGESNLGTVAEIVAHYGQPKASDTELKIDISKPVVLKRYAFDGTVMAVTEVLAVHNDQAFVVVKLVDEDTTASVLLDLQSGSILNQGYRYIYAENA